MKIIIQRPIARDDETDLRVIRPPLVFLDKYFLRDWEVIEGLLHSGTLLNQHDLLKKWWISLECDARANALIFRPVSDWPRRPATLCTDISQSDYSVEKSTPVYLNLKGSKKELKAWFAGLVDALPDDREKRKQFSTWKKIMSLRDDYKNSGLSLFRYAERELDTSECVDPKTFESDLWRDFRALQNLLQP